MRESGSLEQDADVVLLIYRKDRATVWTLLESEKNITEIIIAKHRNGPVGSIKLMFDPKKSDLKIWTLGVPSNNNNDSKTDKEVYRRLFPNCPPWGRARLTRLAFYLTSIPKATLHELKSPLGS